MSRTLWTRTNILALHAPVNTPSRSSTGSLTVSITMAIDLIVVSMADLSRVLRPITFGTRNGRREDTHESRRPPAGTLDSRMKTIPIFDRLGSCQASGRIFFQTKQFLAIYFRFLSMFQITAMITSLTLSSSLYSRLFSEANSATSPVTVPRSHQAYFSVSLSHQPQNLSASPFSIPTRISFLTNSAPRLPQGMIYKSSGFTSPLQPLYSSV